MDNSNSGNKENKIIVKNTMSLYLRMFFVLAISLYTSRVVLAELGAVDYGIYNVVAGFVSLFAFINASLSNAIQRYYNYYRGLRGEQGVNDVYATSIVIQIIIAILLLILVESFGSWYVANKMVFPEARVNAVWALFHTSVVSLVLVVFSIPYSSALLAHEYMNIYALIGIVEVLLKLAVVISLKYVPGDKLVYFAYLHLLTTLIVFALYFIYSKRKIAYLRFKFKYDKEMFLNMLAFSGWNLFGTFAYMLKAQGLNMVLNLFFGPIINAARGIANQVSSAVQGFSSNVVAAFRPQLVESYAKGNEKRFLSIFYSETKITYILILFLILPVIFDMDNVLALWLGKNVPEKTNIFTILVLVDMLVTTLSIPLSQIIHAIGKMKVFQIVTGTIVIAVIPVSYYILKVGFDAESVFVASIVLSVINYIVCLFVVNRIYTINLQQYVKQIIAPCAIFTIVIVVFLSFINDVLPASHIKMIWLAIIEVAIGIIPLYFIVFTKQEKELIKKIIKRT